MFDVLEESQTGDFIPLSLLKVVVQNEVHASQGAEFRLKYLNFQGTREGIRYHEIYIIHFRDDSRKL
jgi:hypothetical protein